MTETLTHDAFLGGRLHVWQPRKGYRAGVDPVLLAAATPAKAGDTVLELGCGVGTASLCLAARVDRISITGVELQSLVIMNPPYFDRQTGTAATDAGRDVALGGDTPLAHWLDVGIRRIAAKGHLVLIQRIERLPEVLDGIKGRLGSVVVCPIMGRQGKAPELFLLRARQDGRAPFRMTSPLIMHTGASHDGDRESYTQAVSDVLRNGAALAVWD